MDIEMSLCWFAYPHGIVRGQRRGKESGGIYRLKWNKIGS